jgi:putative transposase
MPWSETSPMNEKTQFIADYLRDVFTITERCDHYGISRKTGYKWIDRYLRDGPAGLEEQPRNPSTCPHKTPAGLETLVIEARHLHPSWGARKIRTFLLRKHPSEDWPSRTTIHDILKRQGLVRTQRRSRKLGHPGKPETRMNVPNQTWGADFKGHFKTKNGQYCYPLTVTDGYSRYLIGCQSLLSTAVAPSKAVFTRLFKEYGLPERIRTDNGVPFATNTLGRLSPLSAWWIRVGVFPELIEPGKPQQNGRHERMHRTLKAETTRPPAGTTAHNNDASINSKPNSTKNALMKRSICIRLPSSTNPQSGKCRIKSRHSNTPTASLNDTSVLTAVYVGIPSMCPFPSPVLANTLR